MQTIDALNGWLISDGRLRGDEIRIVSTYCETCLLTADVARHVLAQVEALGDHAIRGLDHEIGIFRLPFPEG